MFVRVLHKIKTCPGVITIVICRGVGLNNGIVHYTMTYSCLNINFNYFVINTTDHFQMNYLEVTYCIKKGLLDLKLYSMRIE